MCLSELSNLPENASRVEIKNAIKEHSASLKAAKEQLTNMVPYRALAGFFDKAEENADEFYESTIGADMSVQYAMLEK